MKKELSQSAEEKKYQEMVEEIATNIAKLSRQTAALLGGRLNRKAVVLLLSSMTQMPQRTIEYVLNALEQMEDVYLKKQ